MDRWTESGNVKQETRGLDKSRMKCWSMNGNVSNMIAKKFSVISNQVDMSVKRGLKVMHAVQFSVFSSRRNKDECYV